MAHAFAIHPLHVSTKVRGKKNPLSAWLDLAQQRRALSKLDARALDDIGVDIMSAQAEARRPFWDVPLHWQK